MTLTDCTEEIILVGFHEPEKCQSTVKAEN
jgi:hypothetical protein